MIIIIIIIIDIQFPTIGWVFSHKYNPTTSTTSCSHDRNPQDHLDFCCHWFRWNANITSEKTWWVHYDSTTMSLCLGLFFPGLCNTAEKPDIVKWRCGRWRRWTLVNMEMMLQIYFERLGSSNQGDANQKCACVCICSTLCRLQCCWPRGGKEFNTRKACSMKPYCFEGKTMPPSFHVHNSKCDNPTLAQHQRGGLSFHASWDSRFSPAFSLMREIWWNAPTINHSNQRNQELIEPKDQPQNQTQKSQPPNHPNAQTLPCPSQCCQRQSQCKVLTWSQWKRAVAPVVARKNAPIKEALKQGGFLSCSSTIQNKKTVRQTRLLRRPDGCLHVG